MIKTLMLWRSRRWSMSSSISPTCRWYYSFICHIRRIGHIKPDSRTRVNKYDASTHHANVVTPDNVQAKHNLKDQIKYTLNRFPRKKQWSKPKTCSTPWVALYTRSWVSSRIRLMVWSKPWNRWRVDPFQKQNLSKPSGCQQNSSHLQWWRWQGDWHSFPKLLTSWSSLKDYSSK